MRKFFTRLLLLVTLFSVVSLASMAQSWNSPTLTPSDGACAVAKTGTFTIDFGTAVAPIQGGKISLNKADGTQMYPIQFNWTGTNPPSMVFTSSITPFGTVTFEGNKVIIDFKATLSEETNYYITVHPNSIKNAANGNVFAGIGGTAPTSGTLTCADETGYGWDFTVGDFTPPTVVKVTPLDEAKNVPVNKVLGIKFNEPMTWAEGKSLSTLANGDIALYTSTDPLLGQYGGDVIFMKPLNVVFSGDSVNITWPDDMPMLTNVYVRVAPGIFAENNGLCDCEDPALWEGFNSNGQNAVLGNNGAWNFTTKDNRAPQVSITRVSCARNSNFTITIDEPVVIANTMAPLTVANVKQFITFNGTSAFVVSSVANNPTNTVITIDPTGNLVSDATITVGLTAGLWDSSQNPVAPKTQNFTNGDYTAPVLTWSITNPVGTSFDILAKANEKSDVYYVVVKKADVLKAGVEFSKPTLTQIYDLANEWDNLGNAALPAAGLYNDENYPLDYYFFNPTGTADDKNVNIWSAGKFPIDDTNSDVLERIWDLPRTDGTEYIVYAYAADRSTCGEANPWKTGLLSKPATTVDVLPPVPTITAALSTQFCDPQELVHAIKKDGPIYITFNEPIRLANGSAITPESLENVFEVWNDGKLVGINTLTSAYDAATMKVTLNPDSSFKSGTLVIVKLLSNKVEDMAGVERNVPVQEEFCVEKYCEPLLSYKANKYPTGNSLALVDGDDEVKENATIQVIFDMLVYAPADNEVPAGALTPMVNDPSKINFVGNFIKVRESSSLAGAPTGNIVYANGNEANFDVVVNAYDGTKTIITITPADGYEFGSEMWYNIEVEGTLQSAQRYTLMSGICNDQENNISFQITDHEAPVARFYEADATLPEMGTQFNGCVNCDTPTLNVAKTSRIGVEITEWIELGFDGFRDLEPTESIADANAVRRYFELKKCDGTLIPFDVEDFTLDAVNDVAHMYIDPYNYPEIGDEIPNFVSGESYTIKFISNPNEVAETGPYGPGAFADDHGNIVETGEACFTIFQEPLPEPVCLDEIIIGTAGCEGVKADWSTFSIKFKFNKPMASVLKAEAQYVIVYKAPVTTGTTEWVAYLPVRNMTTSDNGFSYVANASTPGWTMGTATFTDNSTYYVAINDALGTTDLGSFESLDKGCTWPNPSYEYNVANWAVNRVVVDTFETGDFTPPSIVSKTSGTIAKTANLVITYNEDVVPVAGQVVKIYENGTNTLIATVNVGGLNADGNTTVVLPNSTFNTFLEYGKTYYAQFNAGLVTDECGNASTEAYLTKLDWVFTVENDPAPAFTACMGTTAGFSPKDGDNITTLTPSFVIKFSEPVVPVAGKKIDIYEELPSSAISIMGNFNVTSMVPNADKTQYTITFSGITSLATSLTYGNCYHLNIQAGAFKEEAGTQTTAAVVSFETENSGVLTACTWDFCVLDVIAPTVTFWPQNKYENVPLNAYLFAYLSEPVIFDGGWAFTEVNAKNSFKLFKATSIVGTDTTWTAVDFRLDAVGTDADKQRLMFTPLDPDAPDFGSTTNPTMDDDSWYKLELYQPNSGGWIIEDAAGNAVVPKSVIFHTEDILCPVVQIPSGVVVTDITASGFKFTVQSDEKDTIRYEVVGPGTATTVVASGWKVSNAAGLTSFTVTGINALNAQSYKIKITATDNEIDRFATSAQIQAEWPYTLMPGLEEIRIKDIRPAPNTCTYEYASVTLCDDDKPTVTARVPAIAAPAVDPTANITFTLSEAVIVEMLGEVDGMNPDMIVLRDYENNLAIPAVVTYNNTDKKVTINPVETLKDQHRYYVTWDRYAVRDNAMCGNTPVATYNYLDELINKTWWFKTKDKTAPRIVCDILPNDDCTDKNENLVVYVVDGNDVNVNSSVLYIDLYEVGTSIPHERVSTATATKEQVNDTTYKFTFHTVYTYLSNACYTAQVPNNLFKDAFDNTSAVPSCNPWEFCVQDYEAPIASYSVTMDYSYLYVATNDPLYERDVKTGDAGETLTDVPTSSFFKAIFNESVEVLDTVGVDTWVPLNNLMDMDLLANALKVTNVTTGEELEYLTQYRIENTFFNQTQRFRIVVYDDTTHMGYSGFNFFDGGYNYALGSMMSNATYKIELVGGWISDYDDEECDTRNIMDDVVLLTATTRDDTPPTLTLKDANGAVICDPTCPEPLSLPVLNNMGQPNGTFWTGIWPNYVPEWPGQAGDDDDVCFTCVAPEDHITLEFSKPVVKTPGEILNGQPMWWEDGGVDWWTEANLGLDKDDLMGADSRFIKFQMWDEDEEEWVDGPALTDVVITDDQKFDLYWDGKLMSEGFYAITFAPYSVKDKIRVPDGNEFLGLTCIFKVVDHIAPEIVEIHYKNDESSCVGQNTPYPTDVDTDVDLGIEFSERVWKGADGIKLIIRRENGQQQQIIDASQITRDPVNKNLMWINNVDFEENTLYYVEIQEGFVTDTAHCGVNLFAGIDPEDSAPGWQAQIPNFEWVFETGDNTPPEPISLFPNATNEASKESDLIIVFDENVYTDCVCELDDFATVKAAPMTWTGYNEGDGIYIYAHTGEPGSFGNIVEFIPFWTGEDVVNPRIKFTGTDIYNGLTSDKVVIDPVTTFEKNVTYYVRVSDGFFCDGFMNTWDGIGDSTTWRFTITNDVAPEIASFTPAYESTVDAETNGYAITDLTMTFVDEEEKLPLNVKAGSGYIKIFEYIYNPATFSYEEKLWKVIDINDPSVIFQGNLVTVKDVTLLDDINPENCLGPRMYYVTVDPGAITNGFPGSLTYWEGFNDAFDWRFYTGPDNEFMMPYTIVKPVDTLLSIPAASTLEITFAESIEAIPGTTKKVKIFNAEGDVMVDEFVVVPANIAGNKLTLVSDQIVDETEYYVLVEAGAIGDTSTCSTLFPGISDKTVWTFSTGDNTPPVPTLTTVLTTCEEDSVTLTFTFDESMGVTPSTGKVKLMKDTTVFASASVVMGANMNTVTATFKNLPDTTVFTVAWEASVVKDNGNNALANVAVANPAWTFKTADNTAPTITAHSPVATDVESTVTVSVTASEAVVPVAGKKLIVANGVPALVVDVTSMVTTDGKTYTTVLTGLKDTTTYSVTLEAGAFADLSCEPNAVAAVTSWTFRTDDNSAPVITGTTPMNNDILGTYIGLKVEFMFNEPVAKGTGNITIKRGADSEVIPVTGSKVVITGNKVALVLTDTKYFGVVNVAIDSAAFVDLAKKPNASDNYAWNFSIIDSIAPNCMTIISPLDGATNQKSSLNLVMEFCERMAPGDTAKKLKIYEILEVQGGLFENKLFYQTPITAAMINGELVTVPVSGLKDLTSYIVMIDGDAMRDEAGNAFAGINDPVTWNFTVGDNTAPLLVTKTPTGVTEDNHPVFVMEFNEPVKVGDGSLYVFQPGVQGALVAVPITAAMINGNKVTVVYDAATHGALDKDVSYYVLVDNGAVTDLNGNKYAGISVPTDWTFTTGPKFKTSTKDLSSIEFKVYPNPFNDHLNIQNNDKLTRVTITNIAGQRVLDIQYPERVIRTDRFVSGVYIVTLFTNDGVAKSERIVKR